MCTWKGAYRDDSLVISEMVPLIISFSMNLDPNHHLVTSACSSIEDQTYKDCKFPGRMGTVPEIGWLVALVALVTTLCDLQGQNQLIHINSADAKH